MSYIYNVDNDGMAAQASIVWGIAIQKLHADGVLTDNQKNDYLDYTVVVVTKSSLADRFRKLFRDPEEVGTHQIKYRIVNMKEIL